MLSADLVSSFLLLIHASRPPRSITVFGFIPFLVLRGLIGTGIVVAIIGNVVVQALKDADRYITNNSNQGGGGECNGWALINFLILFAVIVFGSWVTGN